METPEDIKPKSDTVEVIIDHPLSNTMREIKTFIGLLGYYRIFIENFARITQIFTLYLMKIPGIKHYQNFHQAFNHCKKILITDLLRQYSEFEKNPHISNRCL